MLQKGDIIICICQVVMFTMLHSSSLGMRIKCGAHLPRQRRTAKLGSNPKKTNESGTVVGKPFRILYQEPKTLLIAFCTTLLPWDPEQNTAKPAGPAEYDPQLP